MTIHVNIGEAKTRLSELVAAAVRGEEVVVARAGIPQARLVALADASDAERTSRLERRRGAIGMWLNVIGNRSIDVSTLKPDDADIDERYGRKFDDPA